MREHELLGLVVAIVVVVLALVLVTGTHSSFSSPEEMIEMYKKEWNYEFNGTDKASTCGTFSSPEAARLQLHLSVELLNCKEERTRVIGFLEEENLYGFLTCVKIAESNYFCCAEISTEPTKSFLDWKQRCT